MSSGVQRVLIVILAIGLGAILGVAVIRYQFKKMFPLKATWGNSTLRVYSNTDGPWVITHFVKLRDGTNDHAIAALPSPVAIVDSGGEHFTTSFLHSLVWISHPGQTSSPPKFGHPMKVFYFVPEQSK